MSSNMHPGVIQVHDDLYGGVVLKWLWEGRDVVLLFFIFIPRGSLFQKLSTDLCIKIKKG
jgi:hypothetical protein